MPDPYDYVYPLPTASPFEDIQQYIPLLLAAVDAELDRDEVWADSDVDQARGFVEDLRAWLADYQETTGQAMFLPIGMIAPFAGPNPPSGWVLCDGRAIDRLTYATLFETIGETYGPGDGSTTFNVPDLSRRVPAGSGGDWSLADQLGEESHVLVSNELPRGVAFMDWAPTNPSGARYPVTSGSNPIRYTTTVTQGHNNIQPILVVTYAIMALYPQS